MSKEKKTEKGFVTIEKFEMEDGTIMEIERTNPDPDTIDMLTAMSYIVEAVRGNGFSVSEYEDTVPFINGIMKRQNLSYLQVIYMTIIAERGDSYNSFVNVQQIASYMGCNNLELMTYLNEFEDMVKRGILIKNSNHYGRQGYKLSEPFFKSLQNNETYQQESLACKNMVEFFNHFYSFTHRRYLEEMSTGLMLDNVHRLMEENKDLPYVKALKKYEFSPMVELIVCHFCRHLFLGEESVLHLDNLSFLFDSDREKSEFEWEMRMGNHYLLKKRLVEYACQDGFESRFEFKLALNVRKKLLKGFSLQGEEQATSTLIDCHKIAEKKLFFSNDIDKRIENVNDIIKEENYRNICVRLKKKGLRQGVACLFYGSPGTGKTESVLQLARQSGRNIMQVNLSGIRSKWVGESEKNIKAVFERYRETVRNSTLVPILLFNEADAIFGTRKKASSSVDRMENSIQNIILQEMETFEGIMIATTNLEDNFDKAFERRFLYKVKFEKPSFEQRAQIWLSMLPAVGKETAIRLAERFDFSGGQIENIVRRYDIDYILYGGKSMSVEKLIQYCEEETLQKRVRRIGFGIAC